MKSTPRISDGALAYAPGARDRAVRVGSDEWWHWLEAPAATRFRFESASGAFTARREHRGDQSYWYAYRRRGGQLAKAYLGRSRDVDLDRLERAAARLSRGEEDRPPSAGVARQSMSDDRATGPHNLPLQTDALIGRASEVERVQAHLLRDEVRLLTLTGPGGTGKTRLAIRTAEEALPAFEDGVVFVDLAPIREPALLISTIARAIGVKDSGQQPLVESVKKRLRPRHALLVLDNFEHLLSAAPDVTELLVECPRLSILVTSREAMGLRWERVMVVAPLELPDVKALPPPETLGETPAVALFVRRAHAADPEFGLTAGNARAVAEICVRLDGLPLAIDLAAARITELSAERIRERLEHRFDLLQGGSRNVPARHRALREAVAWSYELLTRQEQMYLRRLAVCAGGIGLDVAEAVTEDAALHAIPAVLSSLVAKSLLVADQAGDGHGNRRFRMLETIREYALELLAISGELDATRDRHAEHYLARAEAAERELAGHDQLRVLDRLEADLDNIRAALRWLIDAGRARDALRLAGALGRFWEMHSHLAEGRRWLELALPAAPDADVPVKATALRVIGYLAGDQSDFAAARAAHDESLALWREIGDKEGIGRALNSLANADLLQGDYAAARARYLEALALFRELGNSWLTAIALSNLGNAAHTEGDYRRALAYGWESLRLRRQIGDTFGVATTLNNIAEAALRQGDLTAAGPLLDESLALWRSIGDKLHYGIVLTNLAWLANRQRDHARAATLLTDAVEIRAGIDDVTGVAESLEALTAVAVSARQFVPAARLGGVAAALRQAAGAPIRPVDRPDHERALATARAALGEREFAESWTAGTGMSMDAAARDARATADAIGRARSVDRDVSGQADVLTRREREVAALVARGLTNREIADRLVLSVRTSEGHVERIRGKLGLRSRAQIAAWAVEHGLSREDQETGNANR